MPHTMRALVKREAAQGIWMEDVPIPQVATNEVLIKVEKTAICGTDVHIYNWDEWSQRTINPGLIIGHEFVGRIVELGDGVTGYKTGDRVSAEGHIICGHCRNCRAGKRHFQGSGNSRHLRSPHVRNLVQNDPDGVDRLPVAQSHDPPYPHR